MPTLTEQTIIDKIEIIGEFKAVQVREATQIYRDGVAIGNPAYHRYVVTAGQDYSNLPDDVQKACIAYHTPEVVAAYQASIAQSEPVAEETVTEPTATEEPTTGA